MKQSTKKKSNKKNEDVSYLCGGIGMTIDENGKVIAIGGECM